MTFLFFAILRRFSNTFRFNESCLSENTALKLHHVPSRKGSQKYSNVVHNNAGDAAKNMLRTDINLELLIPLKLNF